MTVVLTLLVTTGLATLIYVAIKSHLEYLIVKKGFKLP